MKDSGPATYILYHQSGPSNLLWPAVQCTDDMAPEKVQRPHGYCTLILLVGKLEFKWVTSNEISSWDPFSNLQERETIPALSEAYNTVDWAMDEGFTLDHWRDETGSLRRNDDVARSLLADSDDDCTLADDTYSADLEEATRRSLHDAKRPFVLLTPSSSSSPPDRVRPKKATPRRKVPSGCDDIRNHFRPCDLSAPQLPSPTSPQPKTGIASFQTNDIENGEIAESKHFVEFLVGPDREPFNIPRLQIENRPYFNHRTGDHYQGHLRLKGDKSWSIDNPRLKDISPEDFQFVADYLQTNDFGYRTFDDDQREEAMTQCIAAWDAGEKLGMDDLLKHVSKKVETTKPWSMEEVLAFAIIVFDAQDSFFDAQAAMKNKLTDFIADNFWEYVSVHGDVFIDRVRRLPELDRDIHLKMASRATQRMESEGGLDPDWLEQVI